MAQSVDLGPRLEQTVKDLVSNGRYGSVSEVLREGVRLVQEREARLAELHAAIQLGLDDIKAGRTIPADEVFASLRARIAAKSKAG